MSKEKVEILVEGGKATAAPPLGPALGSYKVNIKGVVDTINQKTQSFKGMKVPVTVIVNTETKEYEIEIGTPPVSQLIKKEVNIQKGAGYVNVEKVANLSIEQCIKIAKMKKDAMFVRDLKAAVKNVVGSCNSMGILVEGKTAVEINEEINKGKYDKEINEGKEVHDDKKTKKLKEDLEAKQKELAPELERMKAKAKKAEEKTTAPKEGAAEEAKEEKTEAKATKVEEKGKGK
jgi:large subunit ribosomal protein L11